ncbi:MAG: hypothetical protein ABI580_14355 [Burkholderiaceae bacterium]
MSLQVTPLFLDWTFWAAVLALVAIVLSQLPPLHLLFRPKRLEVEVHSRIGVTHKVGNPNASMVVSIRNTGGRELRVKGLVLNIARDGKPLLSLPAQNYFETPSSTSSVLFVPFTLKPGETWAHSVAFLNVFDRLTDKYFRERLSALDSDIRQKLRERPQDDNNAVAANSFLVRPFLELFEKLFVWLPGEYVVELQVHAEPGSASYTKKYRFTLYESDVADLRSHLDDYKFGGGLAYNVERHSGINIPLTEHMA